MNFTMAENTFSNLKPGHYTFTVAAVEDKPDFGKVTIKLRTSTNRTQMLFFNLFKKSNGEPNTFALAQLTAIYCGATGLTPQYGEAADTQAMIGGTFEADLEINESEYNGRTYENVNLRNIEHVDKTSENADDLLANL